MGLRKSLETRESDLLYEELTVRQKKFADAMLANELDSYEAAITAGYSPKSAKYRARDLKKDPKIKAYLQKRLKELDWEAIANPEECLKHLTKVMRREVPEEVLKGEGGGRQVVVQILPPVAESAKAAVKLLQYHELKSRDDGDNKQTVVIVDDIPELPEIVETIEMAEIIEGEIAEID